VLAGKMPIPFNVERQANGRWLVDPSAMIASRKIAERVRKQRAATQPASRPDAATQPR
jgi:hypothetical protein